MNIVSCNKRDAGLSGDSGKRLVNVPLGKRALKFFRRNAMILNLQVEIGTPSLILPEKIPVIERLLSGLFYVSGTDKTGNFPGNAGGKRD